MSGMEKAPTSDLRRAEASQAGPSARRNNTAEGKARRRRVEAATGAETAQQYMQSRALDGRTAEVSQHRPISNLTRS